MYRPISPAPMAGIDPKELTRLPTDQPETMHPLHAECKEIADWARSLFLHAAGLDDRQRIAIRYPAKLDSSLLWSIEHIATVTAAAFKNKCKCLLLPVAVI